ncbi:MAG: TIM barrel protein [Cyanobacteria bacterium P01_B01_bin.77]
MANIGFMQGRLSPVVDGKIQAFPWTHWRDEFEIAQQHRFTAMEWTLDQDCIDHNPFMMEAGRSLIRLLSNRYGLKIYSLTGDCFMQAPFWKVSGIERTRRLERLRTVLLAAADLGVCLVVLPLVDNGSLENNIQTNNLLTGLETIQDVLTRYNLKILFESDFPPQKLQQFISQLESTHFGINYDSGNSAALGYDPQEEISVYGERIYNVHIKDRVLGGTTVPLGTGDADLPKVLNLLTENGYSGQYILQTARATNGNHMGVLCQYRDQVLQWLGESPGIDYGVRT